MLHVYGYAGCTTVKKARDWATNMGVEHDYAHFNKVDDLAAQLDEWVAAAGIDAVFNEKSQTLKKMDDVERNAILATDASKLNAMLQDPRLIKRPVGSNGTNVLTGFDKEAWRSAFA
ncbi:MAG: ArsC/Spx/MgsR family protein [Pseudomonadota bacterium]